MKMKFQLDKERIKKFFLTHGEKVGFGLFGMFFVALCWSAYGREVYKNKPEDLQKATQDLNGKIASAKFNSNSLTVADYPTMFKVDATPVDGNVFSMKLAINPPLEDHKIKRGEPKYLPLAELLADADSGAMALTVEEGAAAPASATTSSAATTTGTSTTGSAKGPKPLSRPAGSKQVGRRWVALRGLIPAAAQRNIYRDMFQLAQLTDPRLDIPYYEFFEVQRAEVKSGVVPAAEDWQSLPVTVETWDAEVKTWAAEVPDRVDPKYVSLDDYMCQPLPPILEKLLPPEVVAHLPQIPCNDGEASTETPAAAATPAASGGRVRGKRPAAEDVVKGPENKTAAAEPAQEKVEFRLFRYFDFSVEPGKTYQYRVKLQLANPNAGLAPKYLQDPQFATGSVRLTDWSNLTPPVFIRRDAEIYAGEVIPSRTAEPKTVVLIRQFDQQTGEIISDVVGDANIDRKRDKRSPRLDVLRGMILNFPKRVNTKDLHTETLLVDMAGGESLDPTIPASNKAAVKAPAELLLLGPDGQLMLRSAFQDGTAFRAEKATIEKSLGTSSEEAAPNIFGAPPATATATGDDFGGILNLNKDKTGPNKK